MELSDLLELNKTECCIDWSQQLFCIAWLELGCKVHCLSDAFAGRCWKSESLKYLTFISAFRMWGKIYSILVSIVGLFEFGIWHSVKWSPVERWAREMASITTVPAICNATGNNWICIKHKRMTIANAISQFLHAPISFIDSIQQLQLQPSTCHMPQSAQCNSIHMQAVGFWQRFPVNIFGGNLMVS